jgi:hypothetical protein
MAATIKPSPADQPVGALPPLNPQQKESLIMLIVLNFAEGHGLLNAEQLEDARASLRALFLRATGEETMLRRLIGMLKINRALNQTFSEMSRVLEAIRKSNQSLAGRHDALRQQLAAMAITPEENTHFVGPLLDYASDFLRAVNEFDRQMAEFKVAKEAEARSAHAFRLAEEARERLRPRFEMDVAGENRQEQQVKKKIIQAFNYAEAESEYLYNKRSARRIRNEIADSLKDFHRMCQMAMKPEMRSLTNIRFAPGKPPVLDIYTIALKAMTAFPRLRPLFPTVQELLRLYQRSFGMFMLDFDKFNNALGPMVENTEDYFQAKELDEDVRTKQKKLAEIEALIAFIEDVAPLLRDGQDYTYPKYSLAVSGHITTAASKWSAIAEELLQMKVAAEAELTTRLA